MRAYLILAGIIALIAYGGGLYWLGDHNGVTRERDRNTAAASVLKDATAVKVDEQAQASSEARTTMLDYLAAIPKIEATTNDSAERVRIVYREAAAKAVPGACPRFSPRPERVRTELDAAYRATATAVSAMRRPGAGSASDGP